MAIDHFPLTGLLVKLNRRIVTLVYDILLFNLRLVILSLATRYIWV